MQAECTNAEFQSAFSICSSVLAQDAEVSHQSSHGSRIRLSVHSKRRRNTQPSSTNLVFIFIALRLIGHETSIFISTGTRQATSTC